MPEQRRGRKPAGPKLAWSQPAGYTYPQYFIVWYENRRRRLRACGTDLLQAEKALEAKIAERAAKLQESTDPGGFTVARALALYGDERAPSTADPERIAFAIDRLIEWWRDDTVSEVTSINCRAYYRHRRARLAERFPNRAAAAGIAFDNDGPDCFDDTVRRELGVLGTALTYCASENYLGAAPSVWLPPQAPPRETWLSRRQLAALIRAARNLDGARFHLPLFILIGAYTAARKESILALQWKPNKQGGHVDLDTGLIDFLPIGKRQTKKRRALQKIHPRLQRFLRYARRRTHTHVIEYGSAPDSHRITCKGNVREQYPVSEVRGSFRRAVIAAGLPSEGRDRITPHSLSHTCCTLLMQAGTSLTSASNYTGKSVGTLERKYWHHHPDFQLDALEAFGKVSP